MKLGITVRLMLWAAGKHDKDVLNNNGTIPADDVSRAAMVGLAVLVTSVFAGAAATTSSLLLLEGHPYRLHIAPAIGLLWATGIFSLDRQLVLSMNGAKIWPTLTRLVVGLAVAISIGMPIEIAIFQDRLALAIEKDRHSETLAGQARIAEISGINRHLIGMSDAKLHLQQQKEAASTLPARARAMVNQAQNCGDRLTDYRHELSALDSQYASRLATVKSVARGRSSSTWSIKTARDQLDLAQGRRDAMRERIEKSTRQCKKTRRSARTMQKEYRIKMAGRITSAKARLSESVTAHAQADKMAREDQAELRQAVNRSLNGGFVSLAEALHKLVWNDKYVRTVYLMILLLWVTLEMAAIFAKLMAGRTCIDALLEAKSRKLQLATMSELENAESGFSRQQAINRGMAQQAEDAARQNPEIVQSVLAAEMQAGAELVKFRALQHELVELVQASEQLAQRPEKLNRRRTREFRQALQTIERAALTHVDTVFGGPNG